MKLRNFIYTLPIAAAAFILAACNDVAEDDRFIYVKPADVNRAVLIEDFTGQMCPNCPTAANEIDSLVEQYGDTAVIAVGIHSGPTGFEGNGNVIGLKTDIGDEYYQHWGVSTQPAGVINRATRPLEYTDWATAVRNEISKPATLLLSVENSYDEINRNLDISVSVSGLSGSTTGQIQVWLTEDNITAVQIMQNGKENMNYVHNHVFRAAVNGVWGDDISVNEGEIVERNFSYSIPETWKPNDVSVVAFVYNNNGVQQVAKERIIEEK